VGFVLAKQGMQDQPAELLRVDGFQVRAIKIGIDVGGKGDAQRIVCVDSYDPSAQTSPSAAQSTLNTEA
jgi:hypothetical protein